MDDELRTPTDPVTERAELARQVTENPIFRDAVETMRGYFVSAIVASTPAETNVREEAYRQIKFLDVFVNTLMGYVEMAAARREEMNLP